MANVTHPAYGTVLAEDTVFDVEVAPLGQAHRDVGLDPVDVLRVHCGAPGLIILFDVVGLSLVVAAGRPNDDSGGDVPIEGPGVGGVHGHPQALFVLAQRLFHPLALGDIDDDADDLYGPSVR